MEKWKAKASFEEADHLFQLKRYSDALELLNKLNREFPGNHRVMMARALCLAEVGRYHEAITACDEILARGQYPRAAHLRKKLRRFLKEATPKRRPIGLQLIETPAEPAEPAAVAAFGDEPPAYAPPPQTENRWWVPVLIALAVLGVAAGIGAAAFFLSSGGPSAQTGMAHPELAARPLEEPANPEIWVPDYSQYDKYLSAAEQAVRQQQQALEPPAPFPGAQPGAVPPAGLPGTRPAETPAAAAGAAARAEEDEEDASVGLSIAVIAGIVFAAFAIEYMVLFATLSLLHKMPHETLAPNLLLIGGVAAASVLLSRIPYVGWFASVFVIVTAFELSLTDFLVLFVVNAVVLVGAIFLAAAVIGISLQALL